MPYHDVQLLVFIVGFTCYVVGLMTIAMPAKFINRKRERELESWKQLNKIKNRIISEMTASQSKSGNSVAIIHGDELIEIDLSKKG